MKGGAVGHFVGTTVWPRPRISVAAFSMEVRTTTETGGRYLAGAPGDEGSRGSAYVLRCDAATESAGVSPSPLPAV